MEELYKAYATAEDILDPKYANLSTSEQLRISNERMHQKGLLTEAQKQKHEKLIRSQEELEKESVIDMLAEMFQKGQTIDNDIYGDGDQSPLKGNASQKLRNQWSSGMDFHPNNLSTFYQACFVGDSDSVKIELNKTDDKQKLLEKRETMMRFSALFCIVQGARLIPEHDTRDTSGYAKCMKLLIANGANVHAKDVAGYSILYHCVTAFGNFKQTKKLAVILISAGADPNAQNRFGCTALHENIMMRRYKVLDFLIDNGADPSIADNDGITPNSMCKLLPKGQLLFSKAGFLLGSKQKQAAKASGFGKCFSCDKDNAKKRCTRCLAAYYCDRECQVKHWQKHKKLCTKQEQSKVDVNLTSGLDSISTTINHNTGSVYTSNDNGELPDEKSFKVKVQVPLDDNGIKSPLLVYDKKRSFQKMIESSDPSYDKIVQKIRSEGVMKVKGYFLASVNVDGQLSIQVENMLPPLKW